jgi:hypothetical protein
VVITNPATGQQAVGGIYYSAQAELNAINNQILAQNALSPGSPTRFLLENLKMGLDFQNRTSVPCTLHVYFIKSKRDTWYTPGASGNMIFNPPNLMIGYPWQGDPITAWQQGYNSQVNAASGSATYLSPAVDPTAADLFNEYFRIESHHEVQMAQGGVHRIDFNHHYDKVCDGSVFGETPLTFLRNLTGFIMIRVVGSPVQDTTEGGITTTCPTSVSCVYTKSFRFTQIYTATVASSDVNNLNVATGDVVQAINPGSGQKAPVDFS